MGVESDLDKFLLDMLEAIYFDTLAPIAQQIQSTGYGLLETDWRNGNTSFWSVSEPYADMTKPR